MEKHSSCRSLFGFGVFTLAVAMLLASIVSARAAQVTLVPAGSVWKYRYSTNPPPEGWKAVTFGALEWPSGPARLGYGDLGIVTTLEFPNVELRPVSAYFRNVFVLDNASAYTGLVLRLLRDDGAVVYLNGTEILRNNMPDGAITHTTLATATVGGEDENRFFEFALPSTQLKNGTNVVAVELHQVHVSSSDMAFDLDLQGTDGGVLPEVSLETTWPETSEPLPNALVTPGLFTLRRTGPTNESLMVFLHYSGTATSGVDYRALSNNVVFPAGRREVEVIVIPMSDTLVESNETVVAEFALVPGGASPYKISLDRRRGVVTIHDEDTASVEITQPTEGQVFNFGSDIVIRAVAVDPNGYIPRVMFIDGPSLIGTSQIEFVTAPPNGTPIEHEFVWRNASVGEHTLIARGINHAGVVVAQDIVHIVVRQGELPVVSITATRAETSEPTGLLVAPGEFRVRRTGPTNSPLSVWVNYGGTATKGSDYVTLSNLVTIQAGRVEAKLNVVALSDDLVEGNETVVAELVPPPPVGVPTHSIAPDQGAATVVIHDEDANRVVVKITHPAEGQTFYRGSNIMIRAVASDPHGYVPMVEFYDGEVKIGMSRIDFIVAPTNGTPITHELSWDGAAVGTHSLTARGYSSTGAVGASPVVHIFVVEKPTLPVVSIVASRAETSEPTPTSRVAPGEFTLRRTGRTNETLSVWVFFGGTATKGNDYVTLSNIVTFPAGASETIVQVVAQQDNLVEADETVVAELTEPPTGSPLPSPYGVDPEHRRAVVTIHDSTSGDGQVVLSVEVVDGNASEAGILTVIDPAVFLVKRVGGPTNIPVMVYYEMSGTASNGVDYAKLPGHALMEANQMRLEIRVNPIYDTIAEGEESVVFTLIPPACIAIFPPPPDCYLVGETNWGRAVIRDFGGTNGLPVARIVKPVNGAVFTVGQSIEVVAEASDADGIQKIIVYDNGDAIGVTYSNRYNIPFTGATVGQHVLVAAATDNQGNVGQSPPVTILVREQNASAFVFRHLPDAYTPGTSLTVELRAEPPAGSRAYGVEDRPPTGWVVSQISHEGVFDAATGKVKFGPFIDSTARTLSYRVTPPASATGTKEFSGVGSVDGASYPIGGDRTIVQGSTKHPADVDGNWSIVVNELTGYAAAWKSGGSNSWNGAPIPLSYVTRAGLIWKRGEAYTFNAALGAPPLCWVPTSLLATNMLPADSVETYVRSGGDGLAPGVSAEIQITVSPAAGASAYAVEERVPSGWVVSNVSHEGKFDAATGTIRWGMFLDNTARSLRYTVTPPVDVAEIGRPRGLVSFDGMVREVTGSERIVSVQEETLPRLEKCEATATGIRLQLTGAAGQVGVLQRSSDSVSWEDVTTLFLPDGTVEFVDENASAQAQSYYRLQVR